MHFGTDESETRDRRSPRRERPKDFPGAFGNLLLTSLARCYLSLDVSSLHRVEASTRHDRQCKVIVNVEAIDGSRIRRLGTVSQLLRLS